MREWTYKKDQAGKPRRFLHHGEALLWALLTVGRFPGAFFGFWLLLFLIRAVREGGGIGWSTVTTVLVVALLTVWLLVSSVLYLFVALSGGVMDEEARRRYRNDETLWGPR